ncbi:DUF2264 domain-containing protein [Pseudactinotalea sp. HY160]|uniref:DUF2264 domain-containing protein n=1 Tax=Pseudactinotalea sp. HY160 TaxID=2654490 RepID=UPI00128C2D8F|nr:DUF2264 domain-containing protein [Pseudactinotalea sp. HY160]MPV48994.1 DUF2264 domain-containing protein [Pseudactinotalea sp. HY160]
MGTAAAPLLATRADLAGYADGLLTAVRPHASDGHGLITLPGRPGGSGTWVDGLEGFARTFLLAGFRLAGECGADPHGFAEWYARGLAAGVDPSAADRWPRPSEAPQAKVEAASIALVLDLTRPWIWDALDALTRERLVDYLGEVVGDDGFPRNNWLWFRVVTETFLRGVGGPHDLADIEADLARHDSYYEAGGWYRDGEMRAYDHYAGWAMHLYPALWARMAGAGDLAPSRRARDRSRLEEYLTDAVGLVGADGSPLVQGRSLVYRFGAAAPFWAGAIAGAESVSLGRLRRAAFGIVNHFRAHGVPNARGLLDLGWYRQWRPMAQWYSGPGSPYWASKGLAGLLLPADHALWSSPAEPLPHEDGDTVRAIVAPGWAVSATGADGIVRIANHGTDYAAEGLAEGDDPLYARLGYSTATAPLGHPEARIAPLDQAVAIVDGAGARSHRCGMRLLRREIADDAAGPGGCVALAASRAQDHWVEAPADQFRGSNGGVQGPASRAGTTTVISVLRGAWEVRLIHLHEAAAETTIEAGGWPLADDAGVTVAEGPGRIDLETSAGLRARLLTLSGFTEQRTEHLDEASPLGAHAAVGVLGAPARPGWYALALALTRASLAADPRLDLGDAEARIAWPDGATTTLDLAEFTGPTGPTGAAR